VLAVVKADELAGPQVAVVPKLHFTRQFFVDDDALGGRCVFTGEEQLETDARSPGQLFQTCSVSSVRLILKASLGLPAFDFASIGNAAVVNLGTADSLRARYNVSTDTPGGATFQSLSWGAAGLQIAAGLDPTTRQIVFQPLVDADLQGLLNFSASNAEIVLAPQTLTSKPSFYIVRVAGQGATSMSGLTGAALQRELQNNSRAFLKLYVVGGGFNGAGAVLTWEVLSASSAALKQGEMMPFSPSPSPSPTSHDDDDDDGGRHNGVAVAALVFAVAATILAIVLLVLVRNMRRSVYTSVGK
jgi:hypothetical protein